MRRFVHDGQTLTTVKRARVRVTNRIKGKAGNRHVRHIAVQIAWGWLRHQPDSELSRWYTQKYGWGSSGLKKTGIVAPARRLLIELWRYLETGAIPEGATLKA